LLAREEKIVPKIGKVYQTNQSANQQKNQP
jgi:hypothetical protein